MPLLIGYFRSQVRTRSLAWPYIYGGSGSSCGGGISLGWSSASSVAVSQFRNSHGRKLSHALIWLARDVTSNASQTQAQKGDPI